MELTKKEIDRLLNLLNEELARDDLHGEIYLVGGAVMCLAFNARPSTRDVDALFQPASQIRKAAQRVSLKTKIKKDWLNDAVKGFLSGEGKFEPYLDLSHLKIFTARADYLLAMKCLAMRLGEGFHDLEDVRYLIRYLNLQNYEEACSVITQFYPLEKFPQKTLYALEEIFS